MIWQKKEVDKKWKSMLWKTLLKFQKQSRQ